MILDWLTQPFVDFKFMRHGLAACFALSLSAGPLGVFLVLRRMSLMGDAMSHAILPGVAAGFLLSGLSIWAMSLGGAIAGLLVAILAGATARLGTLREDASLAAFYLIALALGVVLISFRGGAIDVLHILFGSLLAVDDKALLLLGTISAISMIGLSVIYRPLLLESFDPVFLRAVGGGGTLAHMLFLVLVVFNLVAGMQALGTLLSIGLMMLPGAASRMWVDSVGRMMLIATAIAIFSSAAGLLGSFYLDLPSGPAVVLTAGAIYVASLFVGKRGGILWRLLPAAHLEH